MRTKLASNIKFAKNLKKLEEFPEIWDKTNTWESSIFFKKSTSGIKQNKKIPRYL